jgi:hypothetical protein
MEVLSQSFLKNQVPSVKRNETEIPKNTVFKLQVLYMYLTQILLSLDFLVIRRKGRREMEEWQNFFFFFFFFLMSKE